MAATNQLNEIKILLVDNEKDFVSSTEKLLSRRGFKVDVATSGEEARAACEANYFEVVVLDISMPDSDGHDLFYSLKQMYTHTQFIILTGHGNVERAFEMSTDGLFAYLTKPCDIDELAGIILAAAGKSMGMQEQTALKKKIICSVLLIDDEKEYLVSMQKVLNRRGFNVLTAAGGQEGLLVLDTHDIDVVVVDLKMPGMDGLDVLSSIKKKFPKVEVILLTGHGAADSAVKGMSLGAFDYLLKPHNPDELALKISVASEKKKQAT